LPLRPAVVSSNSKTWLCAGCSRELVGELSPNYKLEDLRNVHPEPVIFDRSTIPPPNAELLEFARKTMSMPDESGREKRRSDRRPTVMIVPVQPFDAMLRPIQAQFQAVARNLSGGGICLLHTHTVSATFLAIEFVTAEGEVVQVLVQVLRSRSRSQFQEIGGEFLTKLAASTSRILR